MGSLLLFLVVAGVLSLFSLASGSCRLWVRMPLGLTLAVVYIINLAGFGASTSVLLLIAGLFFLVCLLRWGQCHAAVAQQAWLPVCVALLASLYVGLRPSLLEYPVDHLNYWQHLIEASGVSGPEVMACDMGGLATYTGFCTLWYKLAAATPAPAPWLVSGAWARSVHWGELLLLSLTLVRVWASQKVRPLAACFMLILVLTGTGYLYDAFVINHGLQGSVLAAALLVESAGALSWVYGHCLRGDRALTGRRAPLEVLTWYAVASFYFLLSIKLHGLFALLQLIWLLVVPIILCLLPKRVSGLGCGVSSAWHFGFPAALLTVFLFVIKDAIRIPVAPNFAGVVIRWTDHFGFTGFGDWGPASFVPRTSDTRPEALAVISLVSSLAIVIAWLSSGHASGSMVPRRLSGFKNVQASDYQILASAYVLAVLIAYFLPPFSNLFLKLNPHYSSHMRLMWGACLISPLPYLLLPRFQHWRRASMAFSMAAMAIILLPVQVSSGQRAQLFFSKARHFVVPTPRWADPSEVAAVLVPQVNQIAQTHAGLKSIQYSADPIIASALYPFGIHLSASSALGSDRYTSADQVPAPARLSSHSLSDQLRLTGIAQSMPRIVIQQDIRECFYSVYADMMAYDSCIAASLTGFDVNRLAPQVLRRYGFALVWQSAEDGYRIWFKPGVNG